LEPDNDKTDWTEQSGKALAAGMGAVAGLPLGPWGVVAGAITGQFLEPEAVRMIQRAAQAMKRRNQEVVDIACDTAGLSPEELLTRVSENEELQVLAVKAIEAATRTAWEDKVRTLGKSLASGLLSSDEAEISTEQLIMAAIADMEAPQLALLDLLVAWRPPQTGDETNPIRLDIPEDSHSQSFYCEWDVGQRKWYVHAIQIYRPRLTPVLTSLIGTLERHGLAIYESNVDNSSTLRDESYNADMQRPYVEPTELGEQVWARFYKAGTNVPDVWVAPAPSPASASHNPLTDRRAETGFARTRQTPDGP
jgi:hypothetical protein